MRAPKVLWEPLDAAARMRIVAEIKGLPASDVFWSAPGQDWTRKKAFSSRGFPEDYPVNY